MARHWKIAVACLAVLAIVGLATLPALLRSVLRLRRGNITEEQARRELNQPAISTASDTRVQARLFWASATSQGTLEATQLEMPLSADSVLRARQLIAALIAQVPTPSQRTLPADCELLDFYLLPDGTAIADFSDALSTETPSGILSEQMTVDSVVRTLAENVPAVHQLKILIRGQEQETLAGHIDLSGYFPVIPAQSSDPQASQTNGTPPTAAYQPVPAAAASSAGAVAPASAPPNTPTSSPKAP